MSKLAHSCDETMARIERRRLIEEFGKPIFTTHHSSINKWSAEAKDCGHVGWGASPEEAIDQLLEWVFA